MEKREYYLGIVPRTKSIGWAVTDPNYNIIKTKRKDMWGVRMFEEASTAAERRMKRISRRMRQREIARIGMVKTYFDEAIRSVDPDFMLRLENSKYHISEKDEAVKYGYNIFNDKDYTDVNYYNDYPTIYHLRQDLIHNFNPEKHDIRFVYLAVLNMFKNRGHFNDAGISSDVSDRNMQDIYNDLVVELADVMGITIPGDVDVTKIEEILSNRSLSKTKKSEELYTLFNIDKKNKDDETKLKITIINAITGRKINLKNLFEESMQEIEEKVEFSFRDGDYEEKKEKIAEIIGNENYRIIELMKEINDKGTLASIMCGYNYLSDARVYLYEKHHNDLSTLKAVFKKYFSEKDYEFMFNSTASGSYSAYVGSYNNSKTGKHRRSVEKNSGIEFLYKKIKDYLKKVTKKDSRIAYILDEIETETFLPKQHVTSNVIIPNQIHLKELKKILSNAEEHYKFLTEKDESGLTVSERILELYKFKIPYYVGPLTEYSQKNGGNGWVVRLQEGKVFPWNFNEMINEKATSQEFISRMVRHCTYISEEKVLPKASLEYEAYNVLNEINNLKVDGAKISVKLKQDIYNDLFKTGKKVTKNQLVDYLKKKNVITSSSQLTGIDVNINNYLSSYGKFKAIFGDDIDNNEIEHIVEDIIKLSTIYGDSKKLLKSTIEEKYGDILSAEQIKRILGYKFKDWGNLSKEFLELVGSDRSDHTVKTLIRAMWDNNANMMELINSDLFTYKEALVEKQTKFVKTLTDFEAEDLDCYYFSAPVKRMIWQTILIIREVTKLMGTTPKKIFIETTKSETHNGKRTISRKQRLLELYKNVTDEKTNWIELIEKADEKGLLCSKKVYLYFLQKGRCMYTGKEIDFNELMNGSAYNIDHIYPRHYVKDESLENNLVLVDSMYNTHKSDAYPIEENIQSNQKNMWRELYKGKFISEEKFNRLMGVDPLSDEQKAGFIAKQLTEIYQGTKGVADIIKGLLPDTTVVYVKGSNISEFRQEYDIPKSKLINEFHHANEAYLSIVVGNVYHSRFTSNPFYFIKNEYKKDSKKYHYNLSKMFCWDVERNGKMAWIAGDTGTITTVKSMIRKNTPLITRCNFQGHGKIANDTTYSAKVASTGFGYLPIKTKNPKMADISKYGGIMNISTAYFILVEHKKSNKVVRTLETVPIYLKDAIEANPDKLEEYCKNVLGLIDFSIKVRKIKIQSLVKINGYFAYITGKTGNSISITNAVSLCLDEKWVAYIKKIEKYNEYKTLDKMITAEDNKELFLQLTDKFSNGIYGRRPNSIDKKLMNKEKVFCSLKIEQQCEVLYNLLQCASIGGNIVNLELLNEPKLSGSMTINKNISSIDSFILINQSVTGLYEKSIDLLTV